MQFETKLRILRYAPGPLRRRVLERYYRNTLLHGGDEFSQLPAIVPKSGIALDIGAHLGTVSFALNDLAERVIAFEPNPKLAAMLRGQGLERVEVQMIGLSDQSGEARLSIPQQGAGLGTLRDDAFGEDIAEQIGVTTTRLDDLKLKDVSFIKIDVEGLEEKVLLGAIETIGANQPNMLVEIEERHNPGGLDRIANNLAEAGYSGFFLNQSAWHPITAFNPEQHQDFDAYERSLQDASSTPSRYINNFLFLPGEGSPPTILN